MHKKLTYGMLVHSPQTTFHRIIIYKFVWIYLGRSSCPEVFCKKDVLRNIAKLTGKHLCQSLFFDKVAGLRLLFVLKKRLWYGCSPVNFVKFLRALFLTEHLRWLLLSGPTLHKQGRRKLFLWWGGLSENVGGHHSLPTSKTLKNKLAKTP